MKKDLKNFILNKENEININNNHILWDYSKFVNYKNLINYEMNTIFSYSPIIKIFSKGITKFDNNHQIINEKNTNENDMKLGNDSNKSDHISSNSVLNNEILPNSEFFRKHIFEKNTNIDNISFLNTKRIKKILINL